MDATDWEPLKRLFEQAKELPAEEQRAFLENACSDDPSKRAQLQSLLAAANEADPFFDSLADAVLSIAPWSDDAPSERSPAPPGPDPMIGRTVRQYRIEELLGRGGMGIVYRARDTRLNRAVALKFLPPRLTGAEAATERFLVEARAAAALDHPNVCTVHEIGEDEDGRLFIAMACYEGETLQQKLERGPLPIDEARDYARQIAAGLGAAHAHDIIHRDIKPGNVIVTPEGVVKVLDFGLAKLTDVTLTGTGTTLGTVAYMSPEQAEGELVDHRTDLWSLGVMLYEMLTGERPFQGSSTAAVINAILNEDPKPPTAMRPDIPPEFLRIVSRLLAKDPDDRPASVGASELDGGQTTRPDWDKAGRRIARQWVVAAAAVGVVALAAAFAVVRLWLRSRDSLTITASNITQVTMQPGVEFHPALSPDGSEVAYVVGRTLSPRIAVRSTIDVASGGESRPTDDIPGDHRFPSWTPDGASLRFQACLPDAPCDWRQIGKHGGAARTLGAPRQSDRYAWSADGTLVAFSVGNSIYAYSREDPEPVELGVQVVAPWVPHSLAWSPDNRWIAYVNGNAPWRFRGNISESSIWLISADGGEPVRITDEASMNLSPQWLPDSRHLVFISNRDGPRGIYVVEVGADGPRGEPRLVPGTADPHSISLSSDGRKLAYARLTWAQNIWSIPIPPSGTVSIREAVPVTAGSQVIESHSLSPDEEWIAFDSNVRGNMDIYRMPVDGGTPQMIADLPVDSFDPEWSPGGDEIVFNSGLTPAGKGEILVVPSDGGTPLQLTDFPGFDDFPSWSPDGLQIAFQSQGPRGTEWSVWVLSRESVGEGWGEPVQLTDFGCFQVDWAPDGENIACRATGGDIVRVSRSGEVLSRFQFADLAARHQAFSSAGSTIYFLAEERVGAWGVWSIPVAGGAPTKLVAFDDPELSPFPTLTVGRNRFYLTLAEYESDIWVMDLEW